jgi:predicted anti-sigma-YlaC factor YlaD
MHVVDQNRGTSMISGRTAPVRAESRQSWALVVLIATVATTGSACSLKTYAVKTVADTMSHPSDVFTRDDDPELVRAALPFGLKTFETLLDTLPNDPSLLLATCRGFTSYSYAFVETEADLLGSDQYERAKALRDEAVRLYLRARGYCWRALEVRFNTEIGDRLKGDHEGALAGAVKDDVPLLYWSAASLGGAIALAKGRADLVVDLPVVRAMLERALTLDEGWSNGALHELMITIEAQGKALGGSETRARKQFDRAVALQMGRSPGPYVALAMNISRANQNRTEFEKLLHQALAIDPTADTSNQLTTIITQRRARALLEHIDDYFID